MGLEIKYTNKEGMNEMTEVHIGEIDYQNIRCSYLRGILLDEPTIPFIKKSMLYLLDYEAYEDKDIYFRITTDRERAVHGALITGFLYLFGEGGSGITEEQLKEYAFEYVRPKLKEIIMKEE